MSLSRLIGSVSSAFSNFKNDDNLSRDAKENLSEFTSAGWNDSKSSKPRKGSRNSREGRKGSVSSSSGSSQSRERSFDGKGDAMDVDSMRDEVVVVEAEEKEVKRGYECSGSTESDRHEGYYDVNSAYFTQQEPLVYTPKDGNARVKEASPPRDSPYGGRISQWDEDSTTRPAKFESKRKRARTRFSPPRDTLSADYQEILERNRVLENLVKEQSAMIAAKDSDLRKIAGDVGSLAKAKGLAENHAHYLEGMLGHAGEAVHAAQSEAEETKKRALAAETQLKQVQDLLKTRTEELTVAQKFMTTADKVSVADVSRSVERLNDDIYQCAVFISDMILEAEGSGKEGQNSDDQNKKKEHDAYRNAVEKQWGEEFLIRLRAAVAEEDTLLFEAMVQNVFVVRCQNTIGALDLKDQMTNKRLRMMWLGISKSYETSIAKNWLAMTYSQLKGQENDPAKTVYLLSALMSVAGWREPSPSEGEKVKNKLYEKVTAILATAKNVKDMIIEDVLSAEIVSNPTPLKCPFNPNTMEDANDTGRPGVMSGTRGEKVVCATSLGLQSVVIARDNSSSPPKLERRGKTLVKPKPVSQRFNSNIEEMSPGRPAYTGSRRKLVLAFDVGTTYSGVSYSILELGQVPEIRGVTRFPAQEHVGGDCKIPSILYYDREGQMRAAGAEAMREDIVAMKEDEEWIATPWFKLHLRPKNGVSTPNDIASKIPPLPPNKTAVQVFADFLRYLYKCTRTYIEETHGFSSNDVGSNWWTALERDGQIDFVLSHPNGWEGVQQETMRRAAVLGGLVRSEDDAGDRISFVTEGEASLHFCLHSGLSMDVMKEGSGVLIVDAGGGTVDMSAYARAKSEDWFEEIAAPQCHFQGSIFVTFNARAFLETHLRTSKFIDDVPHISECFDKTTKLRFRSKNDPQYIRFGGVRDKDLSYGIRSGQLRLEGTQVASFFEPSISCIVDSVKSQITSAQKPIKSIFLVGGFAASDWLFSQLKDTLGPLGFNVLRPDTHVNKAVADGAISFYLDHRVGSRMSRYTYGVNCHVPYNPGEEEHRVRSITSWLSPSGARRLPGYFSVILPKNTQVSEIKEFRRSYFEESDYLSNFSNVSVALECYRGKVADPKWADVDPDNYSNLCTVTVDLSQMGKALGPFKGSGGRVFYKADFDIILLFGLTELKAQLCWKERVGIFNMFGVERRSPAKIVYDPLNRFT